jgi:hypothetical protein
MAMDFDAYTQLMQTGTSKKSVPSWEERLNNRRHKGSHETRFQRNTAPAPVKQGRYVIDNGGFRAGPKYLRSFNAFYDGPGKGTN